MTDRVTEEMQDDDRLRTRRNILSSMGVAIHRVSHGLALGDDAEYLADIDEKLREIRDAFAERYKLAVPN